MYHLPSDDSNKNRREQRLANSVWPCVCMNGQNFAKARSIWKHSVPGNGVYEVYDVHGHD